MTKSSKSTAVERRHVALVDPYADLDIEVARGGELVLEDMDPPALPPIDPERMGRIRKIYHELLADDAHVEKVLEELDEAAAS